MASRQWELELGALRPPSRPIAATAQLLDAPPSSSLTSGDPQQRRQIVSNPRTEEGSVEASPLVNEPRLLAKLLVEEVTVLRELLSAMRESRDSWKARAERLADFAEDLGSVLTLPSRRVGDRGAGSTGSV